MRVRARLDEAGVGRLSISGVARSLAGEPIRSAHAVLDGPDGARSIPLTVETRADGTVRIDGDADLPGVTAWWPHTHGVPALHRLKIELETNAGRASIDAGRVGFRSVAAGPAGHRIAVDGLDLRINGRPIFARGAVWTPADPERISADDTTLRASLERVRAAGMNMIRIPGVGAYEDDRFHDLCDELGILVWQDLAFANLDYPFGDAEFHATCAAEVDALIERLAGRPSLAVVCGNSEIEQQVAMLGLDPELGRNPFFADELGDRLAAAELRRDRAAVDADRRRSAVPDRHRDRPLLRRRRISPAARRHPERGRPVRRRVPRLLEPARRRGRRGRPGRPGRQGIANGRPGRAARRGRPASPAIAAPSGISRTCAITTCASSTASTPRHSAARTRGAGSSSAGR